MRRVSLVACAALLAVGCAVQDPPALTEIHNANSELQAAKKAGAHERFPDDYAELEKRYQLARGTFYACQDSKAMAMAQTLVADAQALATKRAVVQAPVPANQDPVARLSAPSEGTINVDLKFTGEESYDPDGGPLVYVWNFGDGTTARSTSPTATHQFKSVGNYNVQLTVEDARGAADTAMSLVAVVQQEVIRSDVLFALNKATLRPAAEAVLAGTVEYMLKNTSYQAVVVGHTDSTGTAEYNMGLSERRALAVRNFLIANGMQAERIIVEWKGETEPVASNATKEGRAQNRRTEITLRPMPPIMG